MNRVISTMNAVLALDIIKLKAGINEPLPRLFYELRYNENHDEKGRFTFGSSGSTSSKKSLTTSKKNVRLDSNGVPFKYPTVQLPKKEYANVVGEIGRNWHAKYEGKEFCRIKFTNKTYSFENRGIGDYNIYRVVKE